MTEDETEEGNPAGLSSCSGGLRPLVELCVEPSGLCGRCTGVAVPLRVVPSPTGLPWKRGPGLGSFSRADRGIGGVRPVAPPTWLATQGNRLSCRDQEGRRGSEEAVPGPRCPGPLLRRP